jgi:hypothetical protein
MVTMPLPLRRSLAPFYALSLLIAVLAAAAALAGLHYPSRRPPHLTLQLTATSQLPITIP